jgi:hypothetical protein
MRTLKPILLLCAFLLTITATWASSARWMSLDELVAQAETIVIGRCVSVVLEHDNQLDLEVSRVRFELRQVLKGNASRVLEFRQVAGGISGLPEFREGEESLLLLYPTSRSGLTTAVGLTQGAFALQQNKQGARMALNGFGNRRLQAPDDPGGAIAEERLVALIADAIRQQRGR